MLVRDIGPRDAKIVIVGEAPGAEEERQGIPFCGPSGKLLKQLLNHSNVPFDRCYITNIVNVRPPGNDFAYFYDGDVPKKELEEAWKVLQDKIDLIKPKVCILLGSEALRAVTNKTGITNWRGCFLSYKDTLLMPTYHPAAVLREYSLHPIVEKDFEKAAYKCPKEWPETIIQPSLQQIVDFILEAKRAARIAWDLETIGKSIRCLGLSFRSFEGLVKAISIPFIKFSDSSLVSISPPSGGNFIRFSSCSSSLSSYWSTEDEVIVLEELERLFQSGVPFVGQNSISFDEPLFYNSFLIRPKNHFFDLMHAFHLLYCELPKGLDFICSLFTCYPNYWTDKNTENDIEEWFYNARDCIVTLEASEIVEKELEEAKLSEFYRTHVHPLCFDVMKLQSNGVLIDSTVRAKHRTNATSLADSALSKLKELTGQDVNPNSPKQMKELLYDKLRFPQMRGRNKKITTDEEALRSLAQRYPGQPILQEIINYRKATKLIGTYLDVKTSPDGRMRSSFNPSGTETGRLSSSRDLFGEGMDLQNIPAGKGLDIVNIKDMFIAPPGRLLLKGDLKQAETMVVAEILLRLGYPQMHNLYQDKSFDVHRWAGSFTFNKPADQITKRERDVCKIRNHSGNYQAGPHVMVKTALKYGVDIDYNLAKKLIEDHKRQVRGLKEWWYDVERTIKRTRMLANCFGRRRVFFGRLDETTIREAVAFEPQSTVGDLNNIILRNLFSILPEGCFPVLQVHDEIVIELPEEKLDECINCYFKSALVPCFISGGTPLVIPVELSHGNDWKNTAEVK